jgi:hypothetical protein
MFSGDLVSPLFHRKRPEIFRSFPGHPTVDTSSRRSGSTTVTTRNYISKNVPKRSVAKEAKKMTNFYCDIEGL